MEKQLKQHRAGLSFSRCVLVSIVVVLVLACVCVSVFVAIVSKEEEGCLLSYVGIMFISLISSLCNASFFFFFFHL